MGAPHDIECYRPVRVAAKAPELEIRVARIECVSEGRRGLRRPLEGEHALGPRITGKFIGFPARFGRALGRYAH